jgi:hypothetical protein
VGLSDTPIFSVSFRSSLRAACTGISNTMSRKQFLDPSTILLITIFIVVVFSSDVVAFGAGNIPS